MSTTAPEKQRLLHTSETHNVHGIADTAALETEAGSQDKADAAQQAAQSYSASALQAHVLSTSEAHLASAIKLTTSGLAVVTSTNVQGAIAQLDARNYDSRYELKNNQIATWFHQGSLTPHTSTFRIPFPFPATILGVTATVNLAPAGSDIIFDLFVDESTPRSLFATAPKPRILAGARSTASEFACDSGNARNIAQYRALYPVISQVGVSPNPGVDMVMTVRYTTSAHT